MRYTNEEAPQAGDRIKNSAGGLGTVTEISRGSSTNPEPTRITVKWDEGIVEIDYELAAKFTLVSRGSAPKVRHGTTGHS